MKKATVLAVVAATCGLTLTACAGSKSSPTASTAAASSNTPSATSSSASNAAASSSAPSAVAASSAPGVASSAAPAAGAATGTLSVVTNAGGNAQLMADVITAFEKKYPDIKVTQNAIDPTTLLNEATQLYSSSNAPDVGFLQPSSSAWTNLINGKQLLDISDVWTTSGLTTNVPADVVSQFGVGSTQYGVPFDQVWAPVIYYNKSLFQKAGVTAPIGKAPTLAEWNTIISKLKAAHIQPLAVGAGEFPALHVAGALLQTAATSTDPYSNYLTNTVKGSTTPATYATGTYLAAMKVVKQWVDQGVFVKGAATMKEAQSVSLFAAGGAAMLSDGSWAADSVKGQSPSFTTGWFLYPQEQANVNPAFLTYTGDGEIVPAKAKNPAAAKLFLEFLVSEATQANIQPKYGVPVRQDVPESALGAINPIDAQMFSSFKAQGTATIWSPDPSVVTAAETGVQEIITGQKTPEEVAADVQKVADAAR